MSWSDDDWDAEGALEKQLEEKKKKAQEEEYGESSSEEEPAPAPAPKPKPKPKAKEKVEVYVPLADPMAEKARRQRLVEEADQRLADDLFGGCERPPDEPEAKKKVASAPVVEEKKKPVGPKIVTKDAFDAVQLATQADIEDLCRTCAEKVNSAGTKVKAPAHKLLIDSLKKLESELSLQELDALEKTLSAMLKEKKVSKTSSAAEKRKTNEKMSKNTKFNTSDEMATVYGGGYDDWDEDDDWDEEG